MQSELEFGWFLPTSGDTEAFGEGADTIPSSMEAFEETTLAAEQAGFSYLLVPVQTLCWEAWVTSAMIVGRSQSIRPLVAARPGYIQPTLLAKMISTFDQLSGGRLCINLIAGASEKEARADGVHLSKQERYILMDETVELLKRLWTEPKPVTFEGEMVQCQGARCVPRCLQEPHPPFYLGGGSEQAAEISAKHSHVHLFWGDRPERIAEQIGALRERAAQHGRENELGFGMRLQIVVRDTEEEAWAAANRLIEGASDNWRDMIGKLWSSSEANRRMKELSEVEDYRLGPHLWTGLTTVRPGAGVAVVGNPQQVADTLREFVDAGCHSFCLSGYPHAREAERFGRDVMPLLVPSSAG
ncbi:MAG: LLM class flavin-dependent oxidoreductase [Acidobacteriota bacterium]